MAEATLLISSKNYSSWSLRGFLLARLARLDFEEQVVDPDDPNTRAELLLRASSIRVPCLVHDGVTVWDTLAIAEYLNEVCPERRHVSRRPHGARALPLDLGRDAFRLLRAAFVAADEPADRRAAGIAIWSAAQADIDRITEIWRECLDTWKGPWLFGRTPTIADAMYAPVVTRFRSYDVQLDPVSAAYCDAHLGDGPTWRSGSPRRSSSRSRSRNWTSSSDPEFPAIASSPYLAAYSAPVPALLPGPVQSPGGSGAAFAGCAIFSFARWRGSYWQPESVYSASGRRGRHSRDWWWYPGKRRRRRSSW